MNTSIMKLMILCLFTMISVNTSFADVYEDFYKSFKNDPGMESKRIPPKMAALYLDKKENPDAVNVLSSLRFLKYLNYYGDPKKVTN